MKWVASTLHTTSEHGVSSITTADMHILAASSRHNPLTPNDHYSGRTSPLTSERCILYIYSTNVCTVYVKRGIYSPVFFSSKFSLFHNSNVFGSCIIRIFYTGCANMKNNNSGAERLTDAPADLNRLARFVRKTKYGLCACAITFQKQSTQIHPQHLLRHHNDTSSTLTETRSIAKAIRSRLLTAGSRLHSQNNPCGQSVTGDRIVSNYLTRSLIFHQRPIYH